jgi:hypothetical protein
VRASTAIITHTHQETQAMANQDQSDNVRQPRPKAAAPDPHDAAVQDPHDAAVQDPHDAAVQDPHDAAVQRQIHADTEVNRQQAERLKATQPPEIDKKTVEEIAEDAEQRAKR